MSASTRAALTATLVIATAATVYAVRPLRNAAADDAANATALLAAVRGAPRPVCQLIVQAVRNQYFSSSTALDALRGEAVPGEPAARWALSSIRSADAVPVLAAELKY